MSGFEEVLNMSTCGREMKAYNECITKATSQKGENACKGYYKNYQFCLARCETERRDQSTQWEAFKEKWGHYPNE